MVVTATTVFDELQKQFKTSLGPKLVKDLLLEARGIITQGLVDWVLALAIELYQVIYTSEVLGGWVDIMKGSKVFSSW